MIKRNTQERRSEIIELLNQQGEVSVEILAHQFATSQVTVRKDLAALENKGLLLRKYGGAVPLPREYTNVGNVEQISKRKVALAKAAASLIRDHNRIIIDSGHTTAALVPELKERHGLVVMCNCLNIALTLSELENEPTLLMTGGTWDVRSESFQGQLAEQVLQAYDFDQLFIGADGLDSERGTTTYNELYNLSRVMADVAREVIVMAESEKIHRKIHNVELGWNLVDVLVTDDGLPDEARKRIQNKGVKVIRAKTS